MHDYVRGAFEALSWVQKQLDSVDSSKDTVEQLRKLNREIEAAISDIKLGVAGEFRWKLKG